MNKPSICPKCQGGMVQGFIPDFYHGGSTRLITGWHEGPPPQKSFWSGTTAKKGEGIPIGAFRCNRCGYLEFYADNEFAAT